MDIKQKTHLSVEKGDRTVEVILDQDLPLGLFFDALMELKGFAVERMAQAHKEEEAEADEKMGEEKDEEAKE